MALLALGGAQRESSGKRKSPPMKESRNEIVLRPVNARLRVYTHNQLKGYQITEFAKKAIR